MGCLLEAWCPWCLRSCSSQVAPRDAPRAGHRTVWLQMDGAKQKPKSPEKCPPHADAGHGLFWAPDIKLQSLRALRLLTSHVLELFQPPSQLDLAFPAFPASGIALWARANTPAPFRPSLRALSAPQPLQLVPLSAAVQCQQAATASVPFFLCLTPARASFCQLQVTSAAQLAGWLSAASRVIVTGLSFAPRLGGHCLLSESIFCQPGEL